MDVEPHYPRLHKAVRLATKLHMGQDRDGADPLPYITHPMEVVTLLRFVGGITDEDMLCAAALHDTIEECGVDPETISSKCGERTRKLVEGVTRREPSADVAASLSGGELWDLRSKILLEEIAAMSPDEMTIKLADRLSNVKQALITRTGEKRNRYVRQTEAILQIIPPEVNRPLWDAIRAVVDSTKAAAQT
jgi:guanosine-3',5'-bis(diphosphate) 3'-pyrophosphohydrolase